MSLAIGFINQEKAFFTEVDIDDKHLKEVLEISLKEFINNKKEFESLTENLRHLLGRDKLEIKEFDPKNNIKLNAEYLMVKNKSGKIIEINNATFDSVFLSKNLNNSFPHVTELQNSPKKGLKV